MPSSSTADRIVELERKVDQLTSEREEYRKLYLQMVETCRRLEQGLLGQKAERLEESEQQLTFQVLSTLLNNKGDKTDGQQQVERVREHTRNKPTGRKPLPEDLPRVDIVLLPPEVEREGLDAFEKIGSEEREAIERRPSSMVVVRIIKPKFVRKAQAGKVGAEIVVSPPPQMPIAGGLAGPGLLADTLVRRWQDHLPLHRLEGIYAREGLSLARSTICNWHDMLAELCRPLITAMRRDALDNSPYLCVDATGVLVQAKHKCRRGHFWVVVAPNKHILYRYSKKHDSKAVDELLDGYEGHLVADAHAVYDHLFIEGKIVEVGCWSHARRYFFKALTSDPERARVALALIGELFRIERRLAGSPRKKRLEIRRQKSTPVVDKFFAWCDEQVEHVLDDTPIARAIGYARNQRDALQRFLDDGQLPIHNNVSELSLRREVVGRKNWLFVGSDAAGEVNVTFVSLLASCQLHGIEPWAYLRDLLCLIPSWPDDRMLELAPAYWNETLDNADAQQQLAADIFRPITLGEYDAHLDNG